MKDRWTEPAFLQWQQSFEYIEAQNPDAARRIAARVVDAIQMLVNHPYAGHIGMIAETREFAVPSSPFVVVYELDLRAETLIILAIYDGRRHWPKSFPRE